MSVDHLRRDIQDAEQFSASVLRLLDGAPVPEELGRSLSRVREQADQVLTAARQPYVLGVLGEYSAGKTMLIASLLGLLDDLSIGDRPTTGNVTAFWLRQGRDGKTRISESRVSYISANTLAEYQRALGEQLRAAAGASGGGAWLTDGFRRAVAEASAPGGNGRMLRDWYDNSKGCPHDVGRLATQLVAITGAAHRYPALLGTRGRVPLDEIGPLLVITGERTESTRASMEPDPFWLVRHVELTVEIPAEVLDLDRLVGASPWTTGNTTGDATGDTTMADRLVVYDFPGFLNHVSGERDLLLTRTMLKDMDTVVALLKAANADGPASDQLARLLHDVPAGERRGRVLVGVGNVSDIPEITRLRSADAQRAEHEDEVLRQLPSLKELLDTAAKLSPDEPPFLYSGPVALDRLGLAYGRLDGRLRDALEVAAAAGTVAARLPLVSRLRPMLSALALDGGRESVLRRLEERLAEYGLTRRHQRVQAERRSLDAELDRFAAALGESAQQARASGNAAVNHLLSSFEGTLTWLNAQSSQLLAAALAARTGAGGQSVIAAIEQDVTSRVFAWPEWWQILSSTAGAEVQSGPETTESFAPRFEETCAAATATARGRTLLLWESALIQSAEQSITPEARGLAGSLELDEKDRRRIRLLTEPSEWRGMLTSKAAELEPPEDLGTVADAFPMRRPHRFAWAIPESRRTHLDDVELRHQLHPARIIRMREEVVKAAIMVVQRQLDALRPQAVAYAQQYLARLAGLLGPLRASVNAAPAPEQGAPLLDELTRLRARPEEDRAEKNPWEDLEELGA
ncbi:hypothetical protein Aph01nite_42250 [Acrocarpospora phusangensis]|uniref:Dynamin family protein n=1 Tax=Acrocarpospora phusangensis TaxID=1070424 RepID=A0A919QG95_9ACTN|nr:hypothetical protein [Acrocarpospora phusangensis]GIH25915.1 hypothetical protein Aph01nite_42250 [Acrocarpospora phusangensis]